MKTILFKTLTLAFCTVIFTLTASAQLPSFTKIDTGAVAMVPGGHVSSACFDMDNDGDLDLLTSNNGVYISRYFSTYKNERNGYFVKQEPFLFTIDTRNLVSIGDTDNDGDIDLFASTVSAKHMLHFENDGFGNYEPDTVIILLYSTLYPSLIDLNTDGYLDVVGINRNASVTYNDGVGGFLANTSIGLLHEPINILLHGISWGDPDDDGDMDVYGGYSYDGSEGGNLSKNACFLNNGDGTFMKFDDASVIVEDSTTENACVNWVDYDNDGDMDLYVLNFTLDSIDGPLNALYENLGNMQFSKHVFEDEMYRNSFKVSSVWGDLDNDADQDLYVTVENNPLPWDDELSATPFNILYINDGNGGFTNILDHPLAYEDAHTALMFDHDNDGDLDVLLTRYSWSNDGYTTILENEGNDNSWLVLTCEGTTSNRSAMGARIYAKTFTNGKHITQTREITPVNGHLTFANLRVHFGLADAEVIDTLIIRWPSGNFDTYMGVEVNQFYRAVEDDDLVIDYQATNYIEYAPEIAHVDFNFNSDSIIIDLNDHYRLVADENLPENYWDNLVYEVIVEDSTMLSATLNGSMLTLVDQAVNGFTKFKIIADAGFAKRMETIEVIVNDIKTRSAVTDLRVYPNPFTKSATIEYILTKPTTVQISIFDQMGNLVEKLDSGVTETQGMHKVVWDARRLSAGLYFCVLKTQVGTQETGIQTIKLVKME